MVSPLPCSGVMLCSKCPLIPGRRYRLLGGVIVLPFAQKASGEQETTGKQATTSLQAPV